MSPGPPARSNGWRTRRSHPALGLPIAGHAVDAAALVVGAGVVPPVTVTVTVALFDAANRGPPGNASSKVAVVDGARTKKTTPLAPVRLTATLTHFLVVGL